MILSTSDRTADAGRSETMDSTAETMGVIAGSTELLMTEAPSDAISETTD